MDMVIEQVLRWALPSALGAVVGVLATQVRHKSEADRALREGMVALLRAQLIDMHERYVESGDGCPVAVKEQATSIYQPYHALGGNGTGTRLYQEIMEAHVRRDED